MGLAGQRGRGLMAGRDRAGHPNGTDVVRRAELTGGGGAGWGAGGGGP